MTAVYVDQADRSPAHNESATKSHAQQLWNLLRQAQQPDSDAINQLDALACEHTIEALISSTPRELSREFGHWETVKYHRQSRWLEIVSASKAPIKP